MDIENYRHSLKEKMDHARIAERRRKLWLTVAAAVALLVLMIGSVVYVACTWNSGVPSHVAENDFALDGYNAKGEDTNVMTTRAHFYSAMTANLDTLIDKGDKSDTTFKTFVINHANIFEGKVAALKEMNLLDGTDAAESVDNTETAAATPPDSNVAATTVNADDTGSKPTFSVYDSEGVETKVEVTLEQLQSANAKNLAYWSSRDDTMDSTYVKFVKHFHDRLTSMKNSFDTAVEAPAGKENVVTAPTLVVNNTADVVQDGATGTTVPAASKLDEVVPAAPESTLSDLDHSKLAEKAFELADSASNSDVVTSTEADPSVPVDQPDVTLPKDTPSGGGVLELPGTVSDESRNGKPEDEKEAPEPSAKADSSAPPSAPALGVVPEVPPVSGGSAPLSQPKEPEAVVSDPLASAAASDPSLKLEPAKGDVDKALPLVEKPLDAVEQPPSTPEEEAAKLAAATALRGAAEDSKITVL
ncbi:hypothetical protein X943_001301 [Babesia divergens]|uniref:Uncharacterized protein n=1 Tax=Babesia divergens TaxID=32595 RepID=A0AAD9G6U9_BABDI|nr:hypothetical protein X943_001301 [Babesia divergens]